MSKQTKMFIGFGLLAVAGYLVWEQQKPTASFSGGVLGDRQQ